MRGSFRSGRRKEILAWNLTGYDKQKIFRQSDHTIENIEAAIRRLFGPVDAECTMMSLASYWVLEALIGNTDRHHENWGLKLITQQRPGGLGVAPSFDHASSLGRELLDERRAELMAADRVAWYVGKERAAIFAASDHLPKPWY